MDLNERFDVSAAKLESLRERIRRLGVDLSAVVESFSRGGGKGGQHRHKTSNRVTLRYAPMGLVVHAEADRRRTVNRFVALRALVDRIEEAVSPETSPRRAEIEAERRRKARKRRRTRLKYAAAAALAVAAPAAAAARTPADAGVVVMAHGGDPAWNRAVEEEAASLRERLPVELALGMADADSLQTAVGRLEARGVRRVAVVRLFVSADSFLDRTRKILGLEPGAPPRPAGARAGHVGHGAAFHDPASMPLWRVQTKARFALAEGGLMDADEAGTILAERARGLSREPKAEAVLILGHGPADDAEDRRWLARMDRLADAVRRDRPYREVRVETLREDWPERRKAAEARVREWVSARSRAGRVLVVPFRIHGFGPYAETLKGLSYVSDGRGLAPHPLIARWLRRQAASAFDRAGWKDAAAALTSSAAADR